MSPQRIQNELGLAARRGNVKLTEPQYQQAADLVKAGKTPGDAVRAVSGGTAPAPSPAAATPKPRMSAAETREYVRLRSAGKTNEQAIEALQQQRAFAAKYQTPSAEEVRARIAARQYKS